MSAPRRWLLHNGVIEFDGTITPKQARAFKSRWERPSVPVAAMSDAQRCRVYRLIVL